MVCCFELDYTNLLIKSTATSPADDAKHIAGKNCQCLVQKAP